MLMRTPGSLDCIYSRSVFAKSEGAWTGENLRCKHQGS